MTRGALVLSCTILVAAPSGCVGEPVAHCMEAGGDAWCETRDHGREHCLQWGRPECYDYTKWQDGCAPEPPVDASCAAPTGVAGTSSGATGSGGASSERGTTPSTTADPPSCEGPQDCAPVGGVACREGVCLGCSEVADPDQACAAIDAAKPFCVEGACVPCLPDAQVGCGEEAPVCDGDFTCRPCRELDECPASACVLASGRCAPATSVVRVGPEEDGYAYASLGEALTAVPAADPLVVWLASEVEHVPAVIERSNVIVMPAPGEPDAVLRSPEDGDAPALAIVGELDRTVDGVTLHRLVLRSGNAAPALAITDAQEGSLHRLVAETSGGGPAISLSNASVAADRVHVLAPGVGLSMEASDVVARNLLVRAGTSEDAAIALHTDAQLEAVYASFLAAEGSAFACPEGSFTLILRNSLVLGPSPLSGSCEASVTTSLLGEEAGVSADWFDGRGRLTALGADEMPATAVWLEGDPAVDLAGRPRVRAPEATERPGAEVSAASPP